MFTKKPFILQDEGKEGDEEPEKKDEETKEGE